MSNDVLEYVSTIKSPYINSINSVTPSSSWQHPFSSLIARDLILSFLDSLLNWKNMDSIRSFSSTNPRSNNVTILPPITYDDSTHDIMNDDIRRSLGYYLGIVQNFLSQSNYTLINCLDVSYYIDPEESLQQLVVTHWLNTTAEIAMKYWEDIDKQIEDGLESAPSEIAKTIRSFIITSVYWKIDGTIE